MFASLANAVERLRASWNSSRTHAQRLARTGLVPLLSKDTYISERNALTNTAWMFGKSSAGAHRFIELRRDEAREIDAGRDKHQHEGNVSSEDIKMTAV